MNRYDGCVALVTGASRGIGAEICEKLVSYGITVIGCAKNIQGIESLSATLAKSSIDEAKKPKVVGGKLHAIKCDITQESEVKAMFQHIKKVHKRLDICINNAGLIAKAPIMSGEVSEWKSVMEVNVLGSCLCTREAINLMKTESKEGSGIIIQMGCIGGLKIASLPKDVPDPGLAIYNGTKFMVRALAESLRQELKADKSKIRVSTISAGPVDTDMLKSARTAESAAAFPQPSQCLKTGDIANAVVYILDAPEHLSIDVVVQHVNFNV